MQQIPMDCNKSYHILSYLVYSDHTVLKYKLYTKQWLNAHDFKWDYCWLW